VNNEQQNLASKSELGEGSVHVWAVPLNASSDTLPTFERVLTSKELEKAAKFRAVHLQRSFIAARGVLRFLLASYLGVAAGDIEIEYGARGKPVLASHGPVNFNISHSGTLALFAFTNACEVGIDVEQIRSIPERCEIAAQFFCPREIAELDSLPHDLRDGGFFSCWTRKEAYVKGTGEGLSVPLNSFRVTLGPGDPLRLFQILRNGEQLLNWTMHDLALGPEFAAAVVYRGDPRLVRMRVLSNVADLVDFLEFRFGWSN
jgi:4'-phosphopantetheinyl transferase